MNDTSAAPPRALSIFTSRHFRAEREADWHRLERLLDLVEGKSARRLGPDDLIELPRLYRATLSALSVARETSLDAALIAYLEGLSTRAYFVLYGTREPWSRQIGRFFAHGWPSMVRRLLPEILIITALFIASAIASYFLVANDPAWFDALVPQQFADQRNMTASAATMRASLYDAPDQGGLEVFAAFLFSNNARVSIFAFALGFAFGIPTLLLIASNATTLGAFYAAYIPHGLGWGLTGWLMIHGSTELFGIVLAGAAGLHIGRAVAFPGELTRLAAASAAGRRAATVMMGVVIMMAVAALLEGFGRQLIRTDMARFAIALSMFTFWVGYFVLAGRRVRHG
ncbi:stage II sporulation protein M [Sphingomonas sp. FW199]|uniref:stage II sporulation protein M n=1 Tax=Sphingomonas sp. FW199 TaxID=3400217 RepID=UPI003CEA28B4